MSLVNEINNDNNTANNVVSYAENDVVNHAVNYAITYAVTYAVIWSCRNCLFVVLPSNLNKDLFLPYMRPSYWLQLEHDTPNSQVRPISQSPQIATKCTYQKCKPRLYFLYIISYPISYCII